MTAIFQPTAVTNAAPTLVVPRGDRRLITINSDNYSLGLRGEDMLGVVSEYQVLDEPVDGVMGLKVVRYEQGSLLTLDLRTKLNQPSVGDKRQPLVIVRTEDFAGIERRFGLFVDTVSRSLMVPEHNWFPIPAWVRRNLDLDASQWCVADSGGSPQPRIVLNTSVLFCSLADEDWASKQMQPANVAAARPRSTVTTPALRSSGGLLLTTPAETSFEDGNAIVAIPMSCVVEVADPQFITPIASRDANLVGIILHQDKPVPVVWMGDWLGMPSDSSIREKVWRDARDRTSGNTGYRLLIVRTPSNRTVAWLTQTSMRSLRTPEHTKPVTDSFDSHKYLGRYESEFGIISIPNLDALTS